MEDYEKLFPIDVDPRERLCAGGDRALALVSKRERILEVSSSLLFNELLLMSKISSSKSSFGSPSIIYLPKGLSVGRE